MTAEVAILNKNALAFAADSAVTIRRPDGEKIYNTTNKLFTLSKYHPIGIMIYGNASLIGIPWETIIKIYRNKISNKTFKSIKECADNFINFLEYKGYHIPTEEQTEYFKQKLHAVYTSILSNINKEIEEITKGSKKVKTSEIRKVVSKNIINENAKLNNLKDEPRYSRKDKADFKKLVQDFFSEEGIKLFGKLPLYKKNQSLLIEIGTKLFTKKFILPNHSGIVIGGIGENEIYPSIYSFQVEGIANHKLQFIEGEKCVINNKMSSAILPFAQQDALRTFIDGVSPEYLNWIPAYLNEIFKNFRGLITEHINKAFGKPIPGFNERLKAFSSKLISGMAQNFESFRRTNNVDPIVSTLSTLPKEELATIAETFVNLSSFKQKITLTSETVGGPIDVAVISKGDGFIWIKRKFYFKSEYNPFFKEKYLS